MKYSYWGHMKGFDNMPWSTSNLIKSRWALEDTRLAFDGAKQIYNVSQQSVLSFGKNIRWGFALGLQTSESHGWKKRKSLLICSLETQRWECAGAFFPSNVACSFKFKTRLDQSSSSSLLYPALLSHVIFIWYMEKKTNNLGLLREKKIIAEKDITFSNQGIRQWNLQASGPDLLLICLLIAKGSRKTAHFIS